MDDNIDVLEIADLLQKKFAIITGMQMGRAARRFILGPRAKERCEAPCK